MQNLYRSFVKNQNLSVPNRHIFSVPTINKANFPIKKLSSLLFSLHFSSYSFVKKLFPSFSGLFSFYLLRIAYCPRGVFGHHRLISMLALEHNLAGGSFADRHFSVNDNCQQQLPKKLYFYQKTAQLAVNEHLCNYWCWSVVGS